MHGKVLLHTGSSLTVSLKYSGCMEEATIPLMPCNEYFPHSYATHMRGGNRAERISDFAERISDLICGNVCLSAYPSPIPLCLAGP